MNNIDTLVKKLTLNEKINLVSGYKSWNTFPIKRLNIPSISLTDGPLGVRKQNNDKGNVLGLGNSYPSTAFPSAANIANSFNINNAYKMGKAIGEECEIYDVNVLLGPGLNIKKDPRCGRNFEYYSEDPLLSGTMAGFYVNGVQSTNTAACLKHYALNNSENFRYNGSSEVDLRAAFEIYLKSFEIAIKKGSPKTIMCSYNKINGTFASENKWLINDVLRNKLKFKGLVMTDWGATCNRKDGIKAGIDLDMPGGNKYNKKVIKQAIKNKSLSIDELDEAVKNVLNLVFSFKKNKYFSETQKQDIFNRHDKLALELATDSAVLMKNDNILPINSNEKILIIGEMFEKNRYQGAGSSNLNPYKLTTPKQAFDNKKVKYDYIKGYSVNNDFIDENVENEVINKANAYNKIVFVCGLTESYESEGYDRKDLSLPKNQISLINKLSINNDVIVVLFGGSPVELPFNENVKAILNMTLPGQAGGEALRKLLYGEISPSGKLSETWMKSLKDIPFYNDYSTSMIETYKENIFVGYRYYEKVTNKIMYPFGHGLSYAKFKYDYKGLKLDDGILYVYVDVTNLSHFAAAEVMQLYVGKNKNTQVFKANKELKDFQKVYLKANETKTVVLSFKVKDVAYFNNKLNKFVVENGTYPLYIATSSQDIKFTKEFVIMNYKDIPCPYNEDVNNAYNNITNINNITDEIFEKTLNHKIKYIKEDKFTLETSLLEFNKTKSGRFVLNLILTFAGAKNKKVNKIKDEKLKAEMIKNNEFLLKLIPQNNLRAIMQASGGMMQMWLAKLLLKIANISKR